MARTIDQIYTSLLATKADTAALNSLDSTSATAIWRLWLYITAVGHWTLEKLFDAHIAEATAIAKAAKVGTPNWYAARSLEFQLGDNVQVIDNVVSYPTGAIGDKIVTRATAKNTADGVLLIKTAKGAAGSLTALSEPELTQFKGYIDRIQFGGVRIRVTSLEADQLRIFGKVYFDPIYNLDDLKARVVASINLFLMELPFDGLMYRERLRDAIQAVEGVVDVEFTSILAYSGATEYTVGRVYETQAGYMVEDPDAPFLTTLTFDEQ